MVDRGAKGPGRGPKDDGKGRTLLAGALPTLGKQGDRKPLLGTSPLLGLPPIRPRGSATDEGGAGRTVLGLPKQVLETVRQHDRRQPGEPATPAKLPEAAPAQDPALVSGKTVLGLPQDLVEAVRQADSERPERAQPSPDPIAPDPLDLTRADTDIDVDVDIEDSSDGSGETRPARREPSPLEAPRDSLIHGTAPTLGRELEAPAAAATARSTPNYPAASSSRATRLQTSEQVGLLMTTDPALSTSPAHRRELRSAPALGELTGVDTDATRIRLVAGRPIPGTRYRLIRWLGEGGMGVVYEAEHIDIERRVAMKILRLDLSLSPDIAQVFRDEARAANRVGSRNIVQIYDFGEIPDGRLFFCMELIDGLDLADRTDEGIASGELIGILRQVCKALGAAHKAGIVHRDIKPENILLIDDDDGRPGMVKIVDFGVAAILGGEGGGSPIAGTPHYMAPEQIRGDEFDGRLDMYSVGCMAYELLTSKPPFDGVTLEVILLAQLGDPPPPLSEAAPDRMIAPALEAVLRRCLAKEPSDRYGSMDELEAALCEAQISAGLSTGWDDLPLPDVDPERKAYLVANMPSPYDGLERRRPRWLWPLVAVLVALLSVGVTIAMMGGEPTTAVTSEIDGLTEDARKAAIAHRWVIAEGDNTSAYQRVRDLERLGEKVARERADDLRHEFASALVDLGDTLWAVEGAQSLAALYYQWATHFEPTNTLARERSFLTDTELALARKRAEEGEFLEAERSLAKVAQAVTTDDPEKKRALLTEAFSERPPGSSLQLTLLADAVRTSKLVDDEAMDELTSLALGGSPKTLRDELAALDKEGALDELDEPVAAPEKSKAKGKTKAKSKAKAKAEADEEDADLETAERDPEKSDSVAAEGKAALRNGNRDQAETLFHQALSHNSRNATALAGLSDINFDRGAYQKAVIYAERAVKIASKNKTLRIKLGDAYFAVLRYNDALTHYERAAQLGEIRAAARIAKVKAKLGGG